MERQQNFSCVLLAAGASKRMGANKLTLPWAGTTLLEHTLRNLTEIPFAEKLLVMKPHDKDSAALGLRYGFQPVVSHWHALGMHASIRAGVLAACGKFPYLMALADQPYLNASHYEALLDAYASGKERLLAPVFRGTRGNPAIIGPEFRAEILAEEDTDRGCAYLFQRHRKQAALLDLGDDAYLRDLDAPEDLECKN